MKILLIALNYVRRHFIKFLLIIVALALMISSVLFTQIFVDANHYSRFFTARQGIMPFLTINCDVNDALVTDEMLEKYYAGRQYIVGSDKYGNHIGYMDDKAFSSMGIMILRGRMPEKENEIAMSDSLLLTYKTEVGEKVTLTVIENGKETEKEYLVTGLTSDFLKRYNETDKQVVIKKGNAEDYCVKIPSIICGRTEKYIAVNVITGVMYSYENDDMPVLYVGEKSFVINNEQHLLNGPQGKYISTNEFILVDITVKYIVPAFIILMAIAGVYTAVRILSSGQKNNLRLISTIGGTRAQVFLIFFYEAIFISLFSSLLSILSGYIIVGGFAGSLETLGAVYRIPTGLIFGISALGFIILLIFYMIYFLIVSRKRRIRKKKKEYHSVNRLWIKTIDRNSGTSKIAFSVVTAVLVVIFSGGCLWGDFISMIHADNIEIAKRYSYDYLVRVPGGTAATSMMNFHLPLCGLSEAEIDGIAENYPVTEKLRAMTYSLHAYIDAKGTVPENTKNKTAYVIPKEPEGLRQAFSDAGLGDSISMYKQGVTAIPYEYLEMLIGKVNFTKEEYDSGKAVVSLNGTYKVKDNIKLYFLFYPAAINKSDGEISKYIPEIVTAELTVTDSVSIKNDSDSLEIAEIVSTRSKRIIVSDKYLLGISDKFRYDYVLFDNSQLISENDAIRTDEYIADLAKSGKLHLYNHGIEPMLLKKEAEKQRAPYLALSIIYTVVVAFFSYVCINCEARGKIQNYLILKFIGAEKKQLTLLVILSSLRKAFAGIISGAVFYYAVLTVLAFLVQSEGYMKYFPLTNAFCYPILITGVIIAIVLVASVIAALWVNKQEKGTI